MTYFYADRKRTRDKIKGLPWNFCTLRKLECNVNLIMYSFNAEFRQMNSILIRCEINESQ